MTYPESILLVSSNIVQVFINFAKKQRDMLDHEVEESADLGLDSEEPDEEYDDDNLSYLNQGRCFKVNVYRTNQILIYQSYFMLLKLSSIVSLCSIEFHSSSQIVYCLQ